QHKQLRQSQTTRFASAEGFLNGLKAEAIVFGETGKSACSPSTLYYPYQVVIFNGTCFVADSLHSRVLRFSKPKNKTKIFPNLLWQCVDTTPNKHKATKGEMKEN